MRSLDSNISFIPLAKEQAKLTDQFPRRQDVPIAQRVKRFAWHRTNNEPGAELQ